MNNLNADEIRLIKQVIEREIGRSEDIQAEIGDLSGYIKRLQELRRKLGE